MIDQLNVGLGEAAQQRGRMMNDSNAPVSRKACLERFHLISFILFKFWKVQDKEQEIAEMEAWLKANVKNPLKFF